MLGVADQRSSAREWLNLVYGTASQPLKANCNGKLATGQNEPRPTETTPANKEDLRLEARNYRSLNFIGSTRIRADLLKDRGFGIVTLQQVRWIVSMLRTFTNSHTIYQSSSNTRELGTASIVIYLFIYLYLIWSIWHKNCLNEYKLKNILKT